MIKNNHSKYLSAGFMTSILLSLFYSFGTFGFLNLFGARLIIQIVLIGIITLLFIEMQTKFKVKHLLTIVIFSSAYIIGSFIFSGQIGSLAKMYILTFCFALFFYSPTNHLIFFSKALVVATTITCILVLIAFAYYHIYPDELNKVNFALYHSDVGNRRIYPAHFMDYFSFTSGDGYMMGGHAVTRMKGFSNEPSSTIVHYVAPAAMAFMLGGRFVYLGVFILAVNILAIASFTSIIIVILSFAFFAIKFTPKVISKIFFALGICCFLLIILNPIIVLDGLRYISSVVFDFTGTDLISRKIGDGTINSNLGTRHQGIINGFTLVFTKPLGYSEEFFRSGSGILYRVSSRAGWIGILIFSVFMTTFLKNIKVSFLGEAVLTRVYGFSLLISLLLVSIFISGYGWDRIPGIIIILLYFRFLQLVANKIMHF